jgi:hypothetical protein
MQFYIDPGSQFMLRGLDFGRVQYFAPVPRHGNHNEFKWSQFRNKELLWFFLGTAPHPNVMKPSQCF